MRTAPESDGIWLVELATHLLRDFEAVRQVDDGDRGVNGVGLVETVAAVGGLGHLRDGAVNDQLGSLIRLFHVGHLRLVKNGSKGRSTLVSAGDSAVLFGLGKGRVRISHRLLGQ